ncbi:MAG: heavy metal transporter, partial [Actinophytocola sp.]|nr:heavy metal transporter [Actinophytocola sp.]
MRAAAGTRRPAYRAPSVRRPRRSVAAAAIGIVLGIAAGVAACGGKSVERVITPEHCTARTDDGEISLTAEQAQVATTIVAVAIRRGLPHRAVTIALA